MSEVTFNGQKKNNHLVVIVIVEVVKFLAIKKRNCGYYFGYKACKQSFKEREKNSERL